MVHRVRSPEPLDLDFEAIRQELDVPGGFPAEVLAAADRVTVDPAMDHDDATDLELVTIDPPGARDLDQAVAVEPVGDGWRVSYAIADVGAWVRPGGPIDVEARRRTQTYYAPDRHVPLHPPVLGQGTASLLPDGTRPVALWTIDVAGDGTTTSAQVRRAIVRSRAQLTYQGVQDLLDRGDAPAAVTALPELGTALLADARRRQAIELGLPEQEVERTAEGHWTVTLRRDLPVEEWNAQVSLLTGRAGAALMLDSGIGVLRTLPPPDPDVVPRLRTAASSLGIEWVDGADPGAVLAGLDMADPRSMAFADLAAELLRGAAYRSFRGSAPDPAGHAGVGDPYSHVTAPLRRLVDRFTTEICLALSAGVEIPGWVDEGLDELPKLMADGDSRAKRLDRAVVDATEAFVLADRVGEIFRAHVIESGEDHGTVVIDDPAVWARCTTRRLPLGATVSVRLVEADVTNRKVRFERVS